MKRLLCYILILFGVCVLALEPGDEVSVEALQKADFIKGEAPEKWEKGKVYILECWATWCGPCVQVIPHVDELYDDYNDKGLEVIGMNVWEGDKKTASKFVDKKGDGMSYPVAYVEEGSLFETEWLKKAGVSGIPHAFVVKDGVLVMGTHPGGLTEGKIEELLDGELDLSAWIARAKEEKKQQQLVRALQMEYIEAQKSGDEAEIEAVLVRVKEEAPVLYRIFRSQFLVEKKDWDGLMPIVAEMGESEAKSILQVSALVEPLDNVKPELLRLLIEKAPEENSAVFKSRLYTKLGDKENAVLFAMEFKKETGAAMKEMGVESSPFDKPIDLFIQKIKEDAPMTINELMVEFNKTEGVSAAKK